MAFFRCRKPSTILYQTPQIFDLPVSCTLQLMTLATRTPIDLVAIE